MHGDAVDLENADITDLPDLMRVQKFHLARTLIEIVAKRDAVLPFLDLPTLGPELDVNGVASLEHLA